eukprot:g4491.t1
MEDYRKQCKKQGQKELKALPDKVAAAAEFTAKLNKSQKEVRSTMLAAAEKSRVDGSVNEAMAQLLSDVESQLLSTIDSFDTISRWIQLLVPKMEDGGNFGADVQGAALKVVTEARKKLLGHLDELVKYHKDRFAALKDAVSLDKSKKTTTSKSQSKTEGGKAEEAGDKTSTSTSNEETTTEKPVLADAVATLVTVDANWYYHLKLISSANLDSLAFVWDVVTKNIEKIKKPRGTGESSHRNYAY